MCDVDECLPKLLVVGGLAMALGAFSAPASASYGHVTTNGFGLTYQAAVSNANEIAGIACARQGGNLISSFVMLSSQYLTGQWSVTVAGTCFIYP